jgi:hypothetical protein
VAAGGYFMLIVLTGEKGAGKSTFLMELIYHFKKPCGLYPPSKRGSVSNPFFSCEKLILADESRNGGEETVKFCTYFFHSATLEKVN